MKTIVEGVLAGALPWGLVLSGVGTAIWRMVCGVSRLAFAIGVYLPLGTMAAIFVGGCIRALSVRASAQGAPTSEVDAGVLAASGLVAGEGLAGVLVGGSGGRASRSAVDGTAPRRKQRRSGRRGHVGSRELVPVSCCAIHVS